MVSSRRTNERRGLLSYVLIMLLAVIAIGTGVLALRNDSPLTDASKVRSSESQFLAAESSKPNREFALSSVPGWLFVHVGVLAFFQVLSLVAAARIAGRNVLTKKDARVVQFLCEIPMYLGLFGTLMGVCLTQFMAGSLVAPLAYLTTMSGILLHVLGKLTILLPLPDENGVVTE